MLDTFSCILSAWLIHGFSACALLQVSGGCRVTEQSHCLVDLFGLLGVDSLALDSAGREEAA